MKRHVKSNTRRGTRSLWLGVLLTPISLALLGGYGIWRAPQASELELIGVNLLILLALLFPRLRSRLLRRRALVNVWMHRGHPLRQWLQGGSLYLIIQLLIVVPISLLLLIELRHLSSEIWRDLIILGAVCSGVRVLIYNRLHSVLRDQAASVVAREWTVYLFLLGAALIMLNHTLYASRPNFDQRSLSEALLFTAQNFPSQRGGFLSELMFLSALKETSFWWSVINLPIALKGLPEGIIWFARSILVCVYALYQLSILFALSQYIAGSLDIVDRAFYGFLRGSNTTED